MTDHTIMSEINEVNLSYLLLTQRLLREDRESAMFRLGLSTELADIIKELSLSQVVKLAASSLLLCRFRFDDHVILSSLTREDRDHSLQQAHASILLAGQQVEGII